MIQAVPRNRHPYGAGKCGATCNLGATAVAALSRNWAIKPIIERAQEFSYLRFKERLASLLSA